MSVTAKPSGVNRAARSKARHYALQSLYQWQLSGHNLGEIENQFREDYNFKKVDSDFYQDLLHKIPSLILELEAAITEHLDRPLEELDPIERNVLLVGSYELLKRIDVPYRVAINEAVNLAKKFGATDGHKYINGVLDGVARSARQVEISAEAASANKK